LKGFYLNAHYLSSFSCVYLTPALPLQCFYSCVSDACSCSDVIHKQGWTLVDGVYWSIVTGTTVGYGDVTPQTVEGRWVCFFFLPFSVIFVATNLSELAGILLNKAEDGKLQALLKVDLSLEALLSMDQVRCGCVRFMCAQALSITASFLYLTAPLCTSFPDFLSLLPLSRAHLLLLLLCVVTRTDILVLLTNLAPALSLFYVSLLLLSDFLGPLLSLLQDGDGEITEYEFIKFMLTTAGMVDEETLDSLHSRFTVGAADETKALSWMRFLSCLLRYLLFAKLCAKIASLVVSYSFDFIVCRFL